MIGRIFVKRHEDFFALSSSP